MLSIRRLLWGVTAVSPLILILSLLLFPTQPAHAQTAPTPTVDRLAAPPTVPAPTQADEGAQLYWLYCQPCHGDQGQGLTDEWRSQYPEEEQNCWQSGCHSSSGKDKVEFGFVLPTAVPPITGASSLSKFETLGQLHTYIRSAMPYELPGKLTDAEYLAIVAHLAQAHGVWNGTPLTVDNMLEIKLKPVAAKSNDIPSKDTAQTLPDSQQNTKGETAVIISIIFGAAMLGGIGLWRRFRSGRLDIES